VPKPKEININQHCAFFPKTTPCFQKIEIFLSFQKKFLSLFFSLKNFGGTTPPTLKIYNVFIMGARV